MPTRPSPRRLCGLATSRCHTHPSLLFCGGTQLDAGKRARLSRIPAELTRQAAVGPSPGPWPRPFLLRAFSFGAGTSCHARERLPLREWSGPKGYSGLAQRERRAVELTYALLHSLKAKPQSSRRHPWCTCCTPPTRVVHHTFPGYSSTLSLGQRGGLFFPKAAPWCTPPTGDGGPNGGSSPGPGAGLAPSAGRRKLRG